MSRAARLAAPVALMLAAQDASAHGAVQGLGHFFGGVVHPLLELPQILALVALGLLIGQRGLAATRPASLVFASATALGLVAAGLGFTPDTGAVLLGGAGLAGLAVLTAAPLPRALYALLAGGTGLAVGLGSAPEVVAGSARAVMLLGSGVGACVWMFNVVGVVHEIRRPWLGVGVRVIGSWIVACTVLMTALAVAGPRGAALAEAAAPLNVRR